VRTLHNENQLLKNQVTASASVKPQTYFRLGEMTTKLGGLSPDGQCDHQSGDTVLSRACNIFHFAVLSELNAGNIINMKSDLRRCDVSAVDYWKCSVGRASALTSF
jgi:hypothetical protein